MTALLPGCRRRPRAVAVVCAGAAAAAWWTPGVAGAAASPVHAVSCRPLATDPQLQAPLYAQNEGASGVADGWWCQLPHATQMAPGLHAVQRDVSPLADDYALYTTVFASHAGSVVKSPYIEVSDDVESVQTPGSLNYGRPPRGRTVTLARGVVGTMTTGGGSTEVTWRFPQRGVPAWLRAVATVTVTGTGVPAQTVLAVARRVVPD